MVWHVERMENDRIVKRVYVGVCAGRPQKKRINTLKDCLRKRGFDVRQARKMVHDTSECWGHAYSVARGMNP